MNYYNYMDFLYLILIYSIILLVSLILARIIVNEKGNKIGMDIKDTMWYMEEIGESIFNTGILTGINNGRILVDFEKGNINSVIIRSDRAYVKIQKYKENIKRLNDKTMDTVMNFKEIAKLLTYAFLCVYFLEETSLFNGGIGIKNKTVIFLIISLPFILSFFISLILVQKRWFVAKKYYFGYDGKNIKDCLKNIATNLYETKDITKSNKGYNINYKIEAICKNKDIVSIKLFTKRTKIFVNKDNIYLENLSMSKLYSIIMVTFELYLTFVLICIALITVLSVSVIIVLYMFSF